MTRSLLLLAAIPLLFAAVGCEEEDNVCDGSLKSQYDMRFDRTRARQYQRSEQLAIEFLRGEDSSEEKPLIVTVHPLPEGPGSFTWDDNEVGVDSSLLPGRPELPELTSAEVQLDSFTPDEAEAEVQGSLHAMFTNTGSGDAFSLECRFKTKLEIMPL